MKNESSRSDDIDTDGGAEFVKNLDAALKGDAVRGSDAETLAFASALSRHANSGKEKLPSAELRARVEKTLHASNHGSLGRVRALMRRWRVGVLDLAALFIIGVLSVALYRAANDKKESV